MALGAPLAERELRAAVRAGADEARVRPTGAQRRQAALVGDDLPPPHRVPGRGYGGRAEQVLLHPLLPASTSRWRCRWHRAPTSPCSVPDPPRGRTRCPAAGGTLPATGFRTAGRAR